MLVYRVEQVKTSVGPYVFQRHLNERKSRIFLREMYWQHNSDEHPSWYEDGLPTDQNLSAGFLAPIDLLYWFDGFFNQLYKLKFKVVVYQTDEFYEGVSGKQINFKKGAKIKEYRIPEFLMLNK